MSHNPRRQFGNAQVALAVDATIKSNLFQILGIYRQGESATPAEQMAAADDIMSRLVAAIEDTFSPSIASYALSRQIGRAHV